jgi:WD40 repeat protein
VSGGGWAFHIDSTKPGEVSYLLGNDSTVRLWDLASGMELHRLNDGRKGPHQSVAFTPDGAHVLYCDARNAVVLAEIPR